MKVLFSIFILILSFNLFGQIGELELTDTEWFSENINNRFTLDSINIEVNDIIYLEKRVSPGIDRDSSVYGKQELKSLGHGEYAVFWFRQKKSLGYWVIFDNYFSLAIVGETPSWSWVYHKKNNTFNLSYPNRPDIKLTMVSHEEKKINLDGETTTTQVIGLKRIE